MKNDSASPFLGMGAISLSVVIVVLAIACFSVLTFVSANSDYKLSVKSANAVKEYYAADCEAIEILSDVKAYVSQDKLEEREEISPYFIVYENGNTYVCYNVNISESKYIDVKLKINPNGTIDIEKWQTMSTAR